MSFDCSNCYDNEVKRIIYQRGIHHFFGDIIKLEFNLKGMKIGIHVHAHRRFEDIIF